MHNESGTQLVIVRQGTAPLKVDRFAQVRALFDEVIDLPADARAARLHELCADDGIREDVLVLIARDNTHDNDRATVAYAANLQAMLGKATVPVLNAGDTIGVWKVTAAIGEGGMGSVYAVERSDGQFAQKAALKLLRGLPGTESLAAFTRERQIMARFSHPNIARLLDGGTTDGGLPYLVMEHVVGEPLDAHMRKAAMSLRGRLQLFKQVCEAVAFAHGQLVIHCDLKPSNILVTADGRPMLLDFGIAALLDADDGADAGRRQAYTPRYASPELKEGGSISIATDVFSLGQILADILGDAADRDLKAIIARATAKEASSRYPSAALLASDVEHYLSLEPVEARAHTTTYVLGKLLRRRWPVFAIVGVMFLMAVFSVSEIAEERNAAVVARNAADAERVRAEMALKEVAQQRDRAQLAEQAAKRERDLTLAAERRIIEELSRAIKAERAAAAAEGVARREALTAQKASEFLESVFMSMDPDNMGQVYGGATVLLDRARERITRDLANEPTVLSRIIERLALVHERAGRPQEAARIYDEAIAIERRIQPPQPGRLSSLLIYAALFKSNNKLPGPAEEEARESLGLREKNESSRPDLIAQSLDMLALVISGKGRHEEAIPMMRRALVLRELRKGRNPDDEIATSHHNLGVAHRRMGDYSRAIEYYEIGTAMQLKRLGRDNPRYLNTAEQLGLTLGLAGRTDEALEILRHALDTRTRLQGERSSRTALTARELGTVYAVAGRHAEAVAVLRKGSEISAATHGRDSAVYAGMLTQLAESLGELGGDANLKESESLFTEALRICNAKLPPLDPGLADAQFAYGRFLLKQGNSGKAMPHLLEAERIRNRALSPGNPFRSQSAIVVARVMFESGDPAAARERLEGLLPNQARMFAADHEALRALIQRINPVR
jgi:eukaryotic-like serine/threonine-protein kinase